MKNKSDTANILSQWLPMAERQAKTNILSIKTDNRTEFQGKFGETLQTKSIKH